MDGLLHLSRWTLRALVHAGAWRRLLRPSGMLDDELLTFVGLEGLSQQKLEGPALRRVLKERLETLEASSGPGEGVLFDGVRLLAQALELDEVEADVLALAAAVQVFPPMEEAFTRLGFSTRPELYLRLSLILGRPAERLAHALRRDGPLVGAGLVFVSPARTDRPPLVALPWVADLLVEPHGGVDDLLARLFRSAPRDSALSLADYPHVAAEVDVLRRLLSAAAKKKARGVNVLLYGPPGTGKTELARAVAAAAGLPVYEVKDDDEDGDPLYNQSRFHAYLLCQHLVARRDAAVVLFDEVEDVFPRDEAHNGVRPKAFTNRALERNPVPAIWITNDVGEMDPAFLRRFDFALELKVPPVHLREKLVERYLGPGLPEAWARGVARDERVTPAHLSRAQKVVSLSDARDVKDRTEVAGRFLSGALSLLGPAPELLCAEPTLRYDLTLLNASCDVSRLVDALKRNPAAAVCLHGPPGTGKTAFVQHVADALGRRLLVRRASDLLNAYVGRTEANLAEMFRKARAESAVLFLDEADGFLQERTGASRSWEVTQVNELLVQLEAFDGLFFCATNAFDRLDAAALRRFTLKVRFDVPTAQQRWSLFTDALQTLRVDARASPEVRARVERLHGLAHGDVRAAVRRAQLMGEVHCAEDLVALLEEEVRHKPERRAVVGFDAFRPEREGMRPLAEANGQKAR